MPFFYLHAQFQQNLLSRSGDIAVYSLGLFSIRPDTRLPQSRAGGQGPYLRSVEHLGRSSEAKTPINAEKVKCDGPTDGPTKRLKTA